MRISLTTSDGNQIEYDSRNSGFDPWQEIPCLRCGVCCTKWQPLLDAEEVEVVARGLGMELDAFCRSHTEKYPVRDNAFVFRRTGGACLFLKYEGGLASCAIYDFRPAACREWKPSLSRPECQEGLRGRFASGRLVLPTEPCPSPQDLHLLQEALSRHISAILRKE